MLVCELELKIAVYTGGLLWSVMLSLLTAWAVANLLKANGSDQSPGQSESCFSGTTEAASGHLSVFCFIFSAWKRWQ